MQPRSEPYRMEGRLHVEWKDGVDRQGDPNRTHLRWRRRWIHRKLGTQVAKERGSTSHRRGERELSKTRTYRWGDAYRGNGEMVEWESWWTGDMATQGEWCWNISWTASKRNLALLWEVTAWRSSVWMRLRRRPRLNSHRRLKPKSTCLSSLATLRVPSTSTPSSCDHNSRTSDPAQRWSMQEGSFRSVNGWVLKYIWKVRAILKLENFSRCNTLYYSDRSFMVCWTGHVVHDQLLSESVIIHTKFSSRNHVKLF